MTSCRATAGAVYELGAGADAEDADALARCGNRMRNTEPATVIVADDFESLLELELVALGDNAAGAAGADGVADVAAAAGAAVSRANNCQ